MEWKEYLLSTKGWQDAFGNRVSFFTENLQGEKARDGVWLFLDEGLRCGGRSACVFSMEEIKEVLLGCGKKELWNRIWLDWERMRKDVFGEIE